MNEKTEILTEKEGEQVYLNTSPPKSKSPTLPYTLSQLNGDLDNIILMALRKEPNRRYASVEDLSKDISSYLNKLPVTARPNTFFYRASKFYSRNKTASIVGLFLALSLIFGIIATTWQAIIARQQRERAEKRFQDVRKLSNSLLFEITPKIERLQGSTEAREVLVKRALEYLDSLSAESQDDLSLQSELATAYEKVGDVQGNPQKANLGDLQGGIKSYQKAQNIRLKIAEKSPEDTEPQRLLALNYNSIGDFRWWASDIEGSMSNYEKAMAILEKQVEQNPDELSLNIELITANFNKIKVISYNGSYDEAIKLNHELIEKIERLEEKFPDSIEFKRLKGLTLIRTAYDLSWQNRYDILDKYVKDSFAVYEPLLAAHPNDSRIWRDLYYANFQAGGIYIEDNPPLARQYVEKSIEIASRTVENDKLNYQAKFDLAQGYSKLGEVFQVEKKFDAAIENLNKAGVILNELTLSEPKHEGYNFSFANNYARIAAVQAGKGDLQNAVISFQKTLEKHEQLRKQDEANVMPIRAIAVAAQDLADVFEKLKQPDQALNSYQKSVEMFSLLEQRKGISDYDRKHFEKSQNAVERLQKK